MIRRALSFRTDKSLSTEWLWNLELGTSARRAVALQHNPMLAPIRRELQCADGLVTIRIEPIPDILLRRRIPLEVAVAIRERVPIDAPLRQPFIILFGMMAVKIEVKIRLHYRVRNRITRFIHDLAPKNVSDRQYKVSRIGEGR